MSHAIDRAPEVIARVLAEHYRLDHMDSPEFRRHVADAILRALTNAGALLVDGDELSNVLDVFARWKTCQFAEDSPWVRDCLLPAAREALAPIRARHRPARRIFSWGGAGWRTEDRCSACRGKAGVHPCGCWADTDTEYLCAHCMKPWPCADARDSYPEEDL